MKKITLLSLSLLLLFFGACKKRIDVPQPEEKTVKFTNAEYKDDLLFVNANNYQVTTSEPATFSSTNPSITISASGLITRVTSGEVVSIEVTTTSTGKKSTLTALGATDNNFVQPYLAFQGAVADDAYSQYLQGWQTLRKLPIAGEAYSFVVRHGDADNGKDFVFAFPNLPAPANWWKSRDPLIARQLNDAGITRSTDLGVIFKDLKLPVVKVYSSEFYRAIRTAELMNLGPAIVTDSRINHPDRSEASTYLFKGLKSLIEEKAINGEMMVFTSHHPINEFVKSGQLPTFPKVSVFTWTGAYIIKVDANKTITYHGGVSYGMFKYWRDLKLKK
jgi:phosphohistidine phosphatase SixA